MTKEEHDQQRRLVALSMYRSERSQERRDETSTVAQLYAHPRTQVGNVVPIRPKPAA